MHWIIALIRKFISYQARAEALKQDRTVLVADIGKSIEVKIARLDRLEQKIHELKELQDGLQSDPFLT